MCLLTNERKVTYQTGFSLGRPGHALGVGLGVTGGGGQKFKFDEIQPKIYFSELGHVTYQILGDDQYTRIQ